MLKKISLLFVLIFSVEASSRDFFCTGKITILAINRSGTLLVGGPGGLPSTYLCNIETKTNNVEPSACKATYNMLLAAKAQGKEVSITFNPTISSCSSVASSGWATNFNWVFLKE